MDGDWSKLAEPIYNCGFVLAAPLVLYVLLRVLILATFKPKK